jgi:hypothetical protein
MTLIMSGSVLQISGELRALDKLSGIPELQGAW